MEHNLSEAQAVQTPMINAEDEEDEKYAASRAYQAIKELKLVDKDIAKMLQLASSSILLLALPQTDNEADGSANLPKGEERSEQFVLEVSEYFQLIDTIQEKIREAIARVRQYRINPSVLDASQPGAIPPTFGVGLPHHDLHFDSPPSGLEAGTGTRAEDVRMKVDGDGDNTEGITDGKEKEKEKVKLSAAAPAAVVRNRGLQETRVERDAWKGLCELLVGEKERRERIAHASVSASVSGSVRDLGMGEGEGQGEGGYGYGDGDGDIFLMGSSGGDGEDALSIARAILDGLTANVEQDIHMRQ